MYIYIYIKCVYIYVIVCIFLNGAASCDWWNIGTIWYRLLVCFPTMYCSGVATEWRRDSDQLPKRWHSSSMTRNCYHHHSVHGKPNGILLTAMLSCPAFWPFHWGCQQCWQHLYEPGPATVFPALQEARKWVNQSKRQRVHRIWNQIQLLPIIGFQLMTVNDLGWAWNFPISGLHQYPVANWSVSSWAVVWWCARIHFQLLVFAASSWPIFPRMLVSARTCNNKADSEEAISWLYIRFRMYCKQNCRDVQHACLRSARNGASMMTTQAC